MNCERKGWGDMIKLRLSFTKYTTDELQAMLFKRDPANPRRYSWDAKSRRAMEAVLRVRRAESKPSSESLSYGVRCPGCGEYETACICE